MPHFKHPLYNTWRKMKARCYNPKEINYHNYGAKGITVCDAWKASFVSFLSDMGEKPTPSHTLDRIENNKGYYKENCRWATPSEQNYNQAMRPNRKGRHSGVRWIYWNKPTNKWHVRHGTYKKIKSIGYFNCLGQAIKAKQQYLATLNK